MTVRVGITIGMGTGAEFANTFERVGNQLSKFNFVSVMLCPLSHVHYSSFSLLASCSDPNAIDNVTRSSTSNP